jgi:cytochrome P450
MGFLSDLDALPAGDLARTVLFNQWLRRDWRALFAELRAGRPILPLPSLTVLSRWADVVDTLSRNETFRVTYAPHIDPSVGPFMLGRDGAVENWRDKSVMQALATTEPQTVDVVTTVSRLVPLRVVQKSFGFPGPDDASMLRWSWATQADMFHNPTNDKRMLDACVQAGNGMRAWLRDFLKTRQPWESAAGEDVVSRLLRLSGAGLSGFDPEQLISNVCGLLVGAIETTSQAIVNATEQILLRQDVTARAVQAAQANDIDAFDAIVWEALRFNPMSALVVRVAASDAVLGSGTPYEMPVKAGSVIAAGIGSAMFDPGVFPDPDKFLMRRRTSYLHTGFGPHECLGQYVAYAIIPETIRQLMLLPGIRLLDGGASQIDMAGGPFAEHFVLGHGSAV